MDIKYPNNKLADIMRNQDLILKEVDALLIYTKKDFFQVHNLLEKQYATIQARAQAYLSFAGIMITITGFSGRYISSINTASKALIIIGLCLTLASAIYIYARILHITRWISTLLIEVNRENLFLALENRNQKTIALKNAGFMLLIALVCYAIALSTMLLNP